MPCRRKPLASSACAGRSSTCSAFHGYEFVMPPLLEHLDSLLTGSGSDLKLRTFQLVDQLSGRTLGIRADMTPQVARIDAHLLNREGVVRLCYCDSVLHTLPASHAASRGSFNWGRALRLRGGGSRSLKLSDCWRWLSSAPVRRHRASTSAASVSSVPWPGRPGLKVRMRRRSLQLLQVKDVPSLRDCDRLALRLPRCLPAAAGALRRLPRSGPGW